MRLARRGLLGAALAVPALAWAERFAGRYAPHADAVADGVWLVRGADEAIGFANGGAIANTVILASDAGPIVVDPGPSRLYGQAIAELARGLTGKPVGRVYVSHLHPDHSFGAAAFDPALVYALPGTTADIKRDGAGFSDAMYRMLADWMRGTEIAIPRAEVASGEIEFGGRALQALSLAGHSGSDLALLDVGSGTLITGDLVFFDRAPATPHADLAVWRRSLKLLDETPHNLLIPGHGPLDRNREAIAQTGDWLGWLEETLRNAVLRGLDMTEAGNLPIPQRFARMKAARYELARSVAHFYPRLEAELLPRIDG